MACGDNLIRRIAGDLYILSNPEMPGPLNIGQTAGPVPARVAELNSATGVPSPFVMESLFESSDPQSHEAEVHKNLAAARVSNARTGRKIVIGWTLN